MGRTACTEPQCLYKGDIYLYLVPRIVEIIRIVLLMIVPLMFPSV